MTVVHQPAESCRLLRLCGLQRPRVLGYHVAGAATCDRVEFGGLCLVNGIPSTGSVLNISVPVPTATAVTGVQTLPDGSFQFAFTNSVGALFGVLATTNLALPLTNWTVLGGVTEITPGQFQFTDPQATNYPQRFYRVMSP
jgi:hypothetical protein